MGDNTQFSGSFALSKPLTLVQWTTLTTFSKERHDGVAYPSIWCDWEPDEEGTAIRYNGQEKFYGYVEWITFLISHFLIPWGYSLSGVVYWQGEAMFDRGAIYIRNNVVAVLKAQ